MRAGDLFFLESGHDSWAVGGEPYVSIHLMGTADYAAKNIHISAKHTI
jgi:hypothetical protein